MEKKNEDEEPDLEKGLIVKEKYEIQYRLGKGGFGKVYLVTNIIDKKNYAMKVLLQKKCSKYDIYGFKNEIRILNSLYQINKTYVMKLHENGEFKTEDELVRLYFVMDYAEKGDLYQYIHQSNGFGEDLGRYIFKKILEGIHFCHGCNISHLDIKPANILLDDKFNPIINDFGLSTGIKLKGETEPQKLYGQIGTREMKCPQMFEKDKAYYGVDADIFALGVLLFRIVVGDFPFVASNDVSYNDIKNKKYDDFWTRFINASLSKEFKDLFVLMVAYEPKERPKIKYILGKEPWMKKLIKEKPEEYEKLEKEYIAFMTNLEEKIKEVNQSKMKVPEKKEEKEKSKTKSITNDNKEKYFVNLIPKKIKDIRNYKYFIQIEGNLEVNDFMNSLVNKIKETYDFECDIKAYGDESKLKLKITFDNIDDNRKDCIMKIKLYNNGIDEYLLCFEKNQGELEEFYENFLKIKNIIYTNNLFN